MRELIMTVLNQKQKALVKKKILGTMKNVKVKKTVTTFNDFKCELIELTGIKIDFRSQQYIANVYGLGPVTDYDFMKKIIQGASDLSVKKGGRSYNVAVRLEGLKTSTLKLFIQGVVFDLKYNY